MQRLLKVVVVSMLALVFGGEAHAGIIAWTDWTSSTSENGFTAHGTISTQTTSVTVSYNNPQGVAFFQTGSGIDYFQNGQGGAGRNPATSPYTSARVENIPTAAEMIALEFVATQSLTFSEPIANPVFSYVSLNNNGYAFDQDFEILSFSDGVNNDAGYWGAGASSKDVVDLGGGNFEYRLIGFGESHGTIRFVGAFETVSWRSLSNEYWNGFTVGIEGTAAEVFPSAPTVVPEPASLATFSLLGLIGVGCFRRQCRFHR